jgi:hypothetical protein
MNKLGKVVGGINKARVETGHNTRRVQSNFPLIERKLDVISGDNTYAMDFPLTKRNHSVLLTLRVKPDNCCDCDPGSEAETREVLAYHFSSILPPGYEDKIDYPQVYAYPLVTESSSFNWGYYHPSFSYPIYEPYFPLGVSSIDPSGSILIPNDGVYTVSFTSVIDRGSIGGPDSEIIASIRRFTTDDDTGENLDLLVSRKIYSVYKGNLTPGSHIHHLINLDGREAWTMRVYAQCINLRAGDKVGGFVQVTNIPNFSTFYGWGSLENTTKISLLGLGYGFLIGNVFDSLTGEPLQGVTVSYTLGFGGSTTTDDFGAYGFYTLRPSTYSITAAKAGYISQTQTIAVYFDKVSEIDFILNHV